MRLARSRWSGLALAAVLSSLAAPAVAHGAAITIEVKLPKPGGVTVKTVTVGFDIGRSSVQAPRALALEVENATDLPDATLAFVSVGKRTEVRGSARFKVTVVVGRPGGGDEGADRAVRISFVPVEGTGLQAGAVFDGSQGLLEAAVYIPPGKARALLRSLARTHFAAEAFFRLAGSASDNAYAKALTFAAADLPRPDGATAASPAGVSQRGVIAGRASRSQGGTDAVVWVDGQPALLARADRSRLLRGNRRRRRRRRRRELRDRRCERGRPVAPKRPIVHRRSGLARVRACSNRCCRRGRGGVCRRACCNSHG